LRDGPVTTPEPNKSLIGLPLIDLRDDEAFVTSYLQIIQLDRQGMPRALPNHGTSQGYRIHRVVVNRWHLVKRSGEWWVQNRTLLPVDGSAAPRQLLTEGLAGVLADRLDGLPARRAE